MSRVPWQRMAWQRRGGAPRPSPTSTARSRSRSRSFSMTTMHERLRRVRRWRRGNDCVEPGPPPSWSSSPAMLLTVEVRGVEWVCEELALLCPAEQLVRVDQYRRDARVGGRKCAAQRAARVQAPSAELARRAAGEESAIVRDRGAAHKGACAHRVKQAAR